MKFFKKDELKLLWPFYLDSAILTIFFISIIFEILYFREIGFSLTQIGLLTSALALAIFLFEIPTGAIADIFGRKLSVILGIFLSGLVVISIIFFTNFYSLLILFFLWGMFLTLASGAHDAWVVDLLKYKKRDELIQEFYIKIRSFGSFAMLMAGIIGALLVKKFGLGIIWPVTGGSFLLTAFMLSFAKEYFEKKRYNIRKTFQKVFSHSKKSIKYSLKNEVLSLLLIISFIMMFVGFFSGDLTWYPLFQNWGLQEHFFGYLFSATFVLSIFIPYLTKPLAKKIGSYKKYLMLVSSFMLIFLFLIGFINSLILAIALYILFLSMFDFYLPIRNLFFQKFVPSKMRATITSFEGMLMSLAAIIAPPLVGFIADTIGPQRTIFIGSFILIPIIFLYSKIKDKGKIK